MVHSQELRESLCITWAGCQHNTTSPAISLSRLSAVCCAAWLEAGASSPVPIPALRLRLQSRAEGISFKDMARITLKDSDGQHYVTTVSWLHLMHVVTNLTHDGTAGSPEQRECQAASQPPPSPCSDGFNSLLLAH